MNKKIKKGSVEWYKEMNIKLKIVTKELRSFNWQKNLFDEACDNLMRERELMMWFGKTY